MKNKLYTVGYHSLRGVYSLLTTAAIPLDATIVDIRFKPWSQRSDWTQESLLRNLCDLQFGGLKCRYVHIVELGNIHYKGDGPIELLHPEHGIARLEEQLKVKNCIVMCQCKELEGCHRKLVAELAEKWLGVEVEHLVATKWGNAVRQCDLGENGEYWPYRDVAPAQGQGQRAKGESGGTQTSMF